MKKLFFAALSATAIFLASCSNDDLQLSQGGGYQDGLVNFTVEMPAGFASRAISDGFSADKLSYAVFDTDGTFLFQETAVATLVDKKTTVQVPLVNGKSYKVAFVATNANAPYSIEDGQFKVNYTNASANDDIYDAFYAATEVAVSPTMNTETVILKRPFAQVNFAATDWDAAKTAGVTVSQSGVAFSAEVPTVMNLADGTLSTNENDVQAVTFAVNTLPDYDADNDVAAVITVAGNPYKHVGMAYVLAPAGTDALLINTVTYSYVDGGNANPSHAITSVPVKRNHRTNIVGSFFTVQASFDIVVDEEFDDPDMKPAAPIKPANLKAAIEAAQSGDIIALTEAGDITQQLLGLTGVSGKDITIVGVSGSSATQLNMPRLSRSENDITYINLANVTKVTGDAGYILRLGGLGNVTFKNIKIISPNSEYHGLHSAANITYDNCTIEGTLTGYTPQKFVNCSFNYEKKYAAWSWGSAKITFDGCTFNSNETAKSRAILLYAYNASTVDATVNNCTFNGVAASGDKCAIEIHTELGLNGSITINNCTVNGNGWLNENGGLWREVNNYKGTNGEATFNFNVYVDGVHVQAPIVKGASGEYIVNNPLIFKQVLTNIVNSATEAVVVDIQADIDMDGVEYAHSSLGYNGPHLTKHITIKGNNHTISNLEVSGLQATLLPWTASGFTIDGLNLKDCKFIGTNVDNSYCNAAAFGAFCDVTSVNVSNCTLDGVTIGHAKYVGGFVAYCSGKESVFENCVVKNCTFINDYNEEENGKTIYKGHCGGLIGGTYGATITNCTVKDNTFQVNGDRNGIFAGSLWGNGMLGTASASDNTGLSDNVGSVGTSLFTATVSQ